MIRDWTIVFAEEFAPEFELLDRPVQDRLSAHFSVLGERGPGLGRPLVDTLNGSMHRNMKELRFSLGIQVWRFAFAFDPARQCVVLLGGNKAGKDQSKFYDALIRKADRRFTKHLRSIDAKKRT